MGRLAASVLVLLMTVLCTAGCSSETGPASPTPPAPTLNTSETPGLVPPANNPGLPHSGAPKVRNPFPATVRNLDPCQALTPPQVTTILGAEVAGKPETMPYGPYCSWPNLSEGSRISVAFITQSGEGLSGVYKNSKPSSELWRELPEIQGFPAVAHVENLEEQNPGRYCQASIGLADDLSMDISLSISTRKIGQIDACDVIPKVADLSITTLQQQVGQ